MTSSNAEGNDTGANLSQRLKEALVAELDTAEGKVLRASIRALHVEEAKRLIIHSAIASPSEQQELRAAARAALSGALLAEKVQLHLAPKSDSASACLLDPPPGPALDVMAASTVLGAKVQWVAPDDHGSAITHYDLGISPKPALPLPVVINGTTAQITGLTLGTVYSFTVTATNGDGAGPASTASNSVKIGAQQPQAPTAVTATAKGAGQLIGWTDGGGGAATAHVVRAYDAAHPGTIVAEQRLDGSARQAIFATLAKGTYTFGVRPFSDGGFGDEKQSAAVQHTPSPTIFAPSALSNPPLPSPDSLMLFDLGDAATQALDPSALRRRMAPILEKATQWRFDYLKALAVNAAKDTLGYDQLLGQFMQMTMGKVIGAQASINAVLPGLLETIGKTTTTIENLAGSDLVQGIVKKVGDAAATALALEGLIHFLLDQQPLAFWTGLFDGLIGDISHFDRDLTDTNQFLYNYFDGPGAELLSAIHQLISRVDQTVADVVGPLRASVGILQQDINQGLSLILNELEETVVSATTLVTGPDGKQVKQFLGNLSGLDVLTEVTTQLLGAIDILQKQLTDTINALFQDPTELCVSLIKDFIVYPILGILVISFAGGPIAAGILAAIVCVAGIELIRQVARWLAGPLRDVLLDAENKVNDAVHDLQGVLQTVSNLLPDVTGPLKLVASNLAGLAHLLPQQFLKDIAMLVGDVRNTLLSQATDLALAAERALGLENATAFDVLKPSYDSRLTPAPDLPGGADPTLFAGMSLLRDFNLLDRARSQVLNPKETTVTLRLSLFKLLGGLGSPATFAGDAATLFQTFLKGGSLLLKLNEQTLIEQGFPGLYRALIVEMKPIGLLGAASSAAPILPMGIPLTITHLGSSRIRVRRGANPSAPPIALPQCLCVPLDKLIAAATANPDRSPGFQLLAFVDDFVAAMVPDSFDPSQLDTVNMRPKGSSPSTIYRDDFIAMLHAQAIGLLTSRLVSLLDPVVAHADISGQVTGWLQRYPMFGFPYSAPMPGANTDAGRQVLRDAIRKECMAELIYASRSETDFSNSYGGAQTLRERLGALIAEGYRRELADWAPRVAKWGGARYDRERDPQIESLGFVTLVQDFGAESAVFNLLPDIAGLAAGALSGIASGFQAAHPARNAAAYTHTMQYGAFENRGIEGEWLLNLESALNPGTLLDLLLEVTVRGCYDDGLAAAVKSSRQQSGQLYSRAQAAASATNKTLRPSGSLPLWDIGTGGLRTVHYSLRANRQNVLRSALAASEALGTGTSSAIDGLLLDKDRAVPLKLGDPLSRLSTAKVTQFALQFQNGQSTSPLGVLHQLLAITPADFGLSSLDALSKGTVEAIGFAVIPCGKNGDGNKRVPLLRGVKVDSPLLPLLPQFDPSTSEYQGPPSLATAPTQNAGNPVSPQPVPQKLLYVSRSTVAPKVTLADVFGGGCGLTLDFGNALENGNIYDVIFSLSVRTPLAQLTVSPSAISI